MTIASPDMVSLRASRIAVLGDVHLGRPGASTACQVDGAELVALVEHLRREHDAVIINGDLFDLDRGTLPLRFSHELRLVEAAHRDTVASLLSAGVVLLRGNHDRVLTRMGRAALAADVRLGDLRVRVEHGDRFDAPIKRVRWFASTVTWASGRVASPPLRPVYDAMRAVEARLTGEREGEHGLDLRAGTWLAGSGLDALVIGHTHRATLRPCGRALLVNPGACLDAPLRFASLDAQRGTAELGVWTAGAASIEGSATLASRHATGS